MNLLRRIRQALWGTTTNVLRAAAPADAKPAPTDALQTLPHPHLFNESTWDRQRGNTAATILSHAARTASGNSAKQTNYNARAALFFINITAVSGTSPTLKIVVRGFDPVTGASVWLAMTVDFTSTGHRVKVVGAGVYDDDAIGAVYTQRIPPPRNYDIRYLIGGTTPSFTFAVGVQYVV